MTHYVCPACGTTSQTPATCTNAECVLIGSAMQECNCEDGLHAEIMNPVI